MKTSALLAMETFFALSESSACAHSRRLPLLIPECLHVCVGAAVACGPRLGTLLSGFPTPATLTETRGGQLVHLTPGAVIVCVYARAARSTSGRCVPLPCVVTIRAGVGRCGSIGVVCEARAAP